MCSQTRYGPGVGLFALSLLQCAVPFAQVPTPPGIGTPSGGGGSSVSVDRPAKRHNAVRRSSGTSASSGTSLVTLTEVQLEPLIVRRVPAVYPPFAATMKLTGTVLVTLDLASDGTLMQADAVAGPEMLYAACIDAVQRWKFAPLIRGGKAVPVRSEVHIVFTDPKTGESD